MIPWGTRVNRSYQNKAIGLILEWLQTHIGIRRNRRLLQAWVPLKVTQAPPGPDTNSQKNDLKIQFLQKGAGHPISQAPPKYLTRLPSYAFTEAVFIYFPLSASGRLLYWNLLNSSPIYLKKGTNRYTHTKFIHYSWDMSQLMVTLIKLFSLRVEKQPHK